LISKLLSRLKRSGALEFFESAIVLAARLGAGEANFAVGSSDAIGCVRSAQAGNKAEAYRDRQKTPKHGYHSTENLTESHGSHLSNASNGK
jgi:hypothetical protein